jgi:LacI family transcriptional regulator
MDAHEAMESISEPVRLRDVAAVSGVSLATASRVLAGSGASERAAAAVHAAIDQLGYRPNLTARALRSQLTGLVGMIVPSISNPFFSELVEAVEQALHRTDLELVLGDSGSSATNEARRLQVLLDRNVDGILIIPAHHESSAHSLRRARSTPLVQLDRRVDSFAGDYVGVDNALGIQMLLEHLYALGCRRLVFVSEAQGSSSGISRIEAFERLAARLDWETEAPLLGTYSLEFGREAGQRLLSRRRLPDAVVCGSDLIALGLLQEFHRRGIHVPAEVRVTGFDGNVFSDIADPPLTTVRQPVAAIADEAIRLLTSRIGGGNVRPRKSEIAPTLEVRRSTVSDG